MLRFFFIAIFFALAFWLKRSYDRASKRSGSGREMVPDALTGVYFPKDQAVSLTKSGEVLYFINRENRDEYLSLNK